MQYVRQLQSGAVIPTLLMICLSVSYPLSAQDAWPSSSPGAIWGQLDVTGQMAYVRGFIDGAMAAEVLVDQSVRQAGETGAIFVPGTEDRFRDAVNRRLQDVISGTMPAQMQPLVDVITRVYADPANGCIPFYSVTYLSLSRIRGGIDDDRFMRMLLEARARSWDNC